ncbi:MAG: alpha/beta hydrolase [Candidatus Cybelea sp.]
MVIATALATIIDNASNDFQCGPATIDQSCTTRDLLHGFFTGAVYAKLCCLWCAVPGVGHVPPEERPEEINAIILTFLRDINFR